MDTQYRNLFILIAQSVANLAEQVMNNEKTEKSRETAEIMRNDYLDLIDKLKNEEEELVKTDFARILVGTVIVSNQLENKIKNEQKALDGYKLDIIPKLDQINSATDPEQVQELAQTLFKIKEEENEKTE